MSADATNRTIGFAHRGGHGHPDNTLAAFAAALEAGATALESDAWVTADGQVVLDHDGVLRTARRRKKPMAEVRRSELPEHIPTISELYDHCGTDFDLAIDVKTTPTATALADAARDRDALDRLWIVAPHSALIRNLPAANRAVSVKGTVMRSPRRRATFHAIRDAGMQAVNARWPWWTPRFVDEVHALGMKAFGYDAQRESSMQRCLDLGLDAFFSDHVALMVRVLAARPDDAAPR